MDFDEQVAGVMVILRGWIQNLARNAEGEGHTLEATVIAEALDKLREEYDALVTGDVDDIEYIVRHWARGTE